MPDWRQRGFGRSARHFYLMPLLRGLNRAAKMTADMDTWLILPARGRWAARQS
jgi:hypothetical protein